MGITVQRSNPCQGRTKTLRRCGREGDWRFFCDDHRRQPFVWAFIALSVVASLVSIFTPLGSYIRRSPHAEMTPATAVSGEAPADSSIDPARSPRLSVSALLQSAHEVVLEVATDVAMIGILDPQALDHRLRDAEDWWIEDAEMIREMNRGNALFVRTGMDGYYRVLVHGGEPRPSEDTVEALLTCSGGELYIGGYFDAGLRSDRLVGRLYQGA